MTGNQNSAPVQPADPNAPDILRCASMEIVVTDLAKSREFYVDTLGLVVTEEDDNTIYLRTYDEFIHHNLILRQGDIPAVAAFSYRVRSPKDLDLAEKFYKARGCEVRRNKDGFVKGKGDSVRVQDPLGFPTSFSTTSTTSNALPGPTTPTFPARLSDWITSTRSPLTSPRPSTT